ncbi:hypothetical protein [Burkholderia sp. SIMBA_062]|uniref:hypothetical protein n=1 Tax=Burkholderia sp. SIMBA_062 TaxID=3085803 RepID=UPI00397CD1E5
MFSLASHLADNGVGMNSEVAKNGISGHWGVLGMRERIAVLGGSLNIKSSFTDGTTLTFILPT